jgi:hypothetical protein
MYLLTKSNPKANPMENPPPWIQTITGRELSELDGNFVTFQNLFLKP